MQKRITVVKKGRGKKPDPNGACCATAAGMVRLVGTRRRIWLKNLLSHDFLGVGMGFAGSAADLSSPQPSP